jgi:hypothetical protein
MNPKHKQLMQKAHTAFEAGEIQLTTQHLSAIADDYENQQLPEEVTNLAVECMLKDLTTIEDYEKTEHITHRIPTTA